MTASAAPRLSIVIVTYNSRDEIDACLESLSAPAPAVAHDVVIVDNESRDGTARHVEARWPAVSLIRAGANLGFGPASNIGIRATKGELVLLLNPDTRVPPGAIDRLVAVLDSRPDVAVVGPRLVDASGHPELSSGAMIAPWTELRQKVLVAGQRRRWPLVAALADRRSRGTRPVDWVSGACLLARRTDLEAVGLFDERFFMYTEDVDLCAAIRARGRTVLFTDAAYVVHLRGRSAAAAPRATAAAYRRSQLAFYAKHHPRWVPLLKVYQAFRGG